MYSRRAHRNSHHGCRQCKEKRVKCDETQPRCLRCKSKGRDCTYTHLLSAHDPFAAQQQQQRHHAPVPPLQQRLVCRANTLHASSTASAQLEHSSAIFHHYMHVVTTVSPAHVQSEQLWRWDRAVRSFAASHAFLYHAALTYAALHSADLHRAAGSEAEAARHVALAARHQTLSLAGFAPAVAAMLLRREDSTADVDPVLTCSSLILACAFVFPPAPGQHPLDQARQVIRLFQGTQALYARTWTASPGSGSSSISAYVRARVEAGESLGDGASAPAAEASLAAVEERARAATPPDDDVLLALARLRLLVRRLAARPGLHTIALHWPADLPPAFVGALARREHLALVVLAHWAACLARMRHLWWVSRWGAGVVRAVVDEVCGSDAAAGGAAAADGGAETAAGRGGAAAGEWRRCLEWPARALGGEADAVCWHR